MPKNGQADDLSGGGGKSTSSIGRGFSILQVLRQAKQPLSLSAVAKEIGIAPSSAHSVLAQLLASEAVVQDDAKRYALGPVTLYIGAAYARGTAIYGVAWTELVNAANELGVTAVLARPWNDVHLILNSHRAGDSNVLVPLGGRVPLDAGSWGKVYFAWSGDPQPANLTRYTEASIVDADGFGEEVERSRRLDYATDVGEYAADFGGVAAPITGAGGYEGLASFLTPIDQLDEQRLSTLGRRLADISAGASRALGDHGRVRIFGVE